MLATYPVVSENSWTNFWRSSMSHCAWTVLWRTFHSELSYKPLLYRLVSTTFPDPFCPLCGGEDTGEHFLCICPLKRLLWLKLVSRFLLKPTSLGYKHISLPMAPELKVLLQFSFERQTFVVCTVWSLWQFYWKFILMLLFCLTRLQLGQHPS
jgi:hypothetical protein